MKKQFKNWVLILAMVSFLSACNNNAKPKEENQSEEKISQELIHPEWSKDAVIYEVNIRQFTEEGNIKAFAEHLPRLKNLGVDILWLMPIHPIGEKNRKGGLGSYYSVQNYLAVNPEFGTMEEFKNLVDQIHDLGMYVILDWVANHTAWDHPWSETNPEWYKRDSLGNFLSPYDWTDVIALDYENQEMRAAMTEAMKFWVAEADIDGYRCDVAGLVPVDFWNDVRPELDKIKAVFMLAEAEEPNQLEHAFDMNYAWRLHFEFNEIVAGEKELKDLYTYFKWNEENFTSNGIRMNFIDNHDENSWKGTINSRLGEAQKMGAAFMWTIPGMPLIYTGQEAGLDKSLAFFEKDLVDWDKETDLFKFYQKLNSIRKENPALWSQPVGGELKVISNPEDEAVFVISRVLDDNKVLAVFNFKNENVSWTPSMDDVAGSYTDAFNDSNIEISKDSKIELLPYGFTILVN